MKKSLLFVIDSLTIGGAEKSLISLINLIDSTKFDIDLLVFRSGGELEKYIPKCVNILPVPEYFRYVSKKIKKKKPVYLFLKYKISLSLRVNSIKKKPIHSEQIVFKNLKNRMFPLLKTYDFAVAYSQGMPTYFVAHKVKAIKKFTWINTDYKNTLYNKDVDFESYKHFNKIIAVSTYIMESVAEIKKEYIEKLEIIFDIIDPDLIKKMADKETVEEFDLSVTNILTVGRLATVKSYDIAIRVAKKLQDSGYKFKWFVVGEGPERTYLESLIEEYSLFDNFILLGNKINPYIYMKNCDIYVQTSLKEGFGLTVCEAKILKKPIVCTDFPTAKEIINNNIDGLIVKHEINSIYDGILKYINDTEGKFHIVKNLNNQKQYNSLDQIEKFYRLLES